jgi:hypothetical protein
MLERQLFLQLIHMHPGCGAAGLFVWEGHLLLGTVTVFVQLYEGIKICVDEHICHLGVDLYFYTKIMGFLYRSIIIL